MPRATVTSRALKNKETGLEIFVPTFKQQKELLTSVVHFQVVVVTNLACFKTPSHKDSDVVQFSIDKKMNEFEELRNKIVEMYPGTVLPPIVKKSIIVNDLVLRERRNSLDHLLKSISSTPKLSTCIPMLSFLGVDSIRASKFGQGKPLENVTTASADPQNSEEDLDNQDPITFGEEDDSGNEDFFGDDITEDGTDDFFGTDENNRTGAFKVFEGQDMKRDLTDEDENDFTFVPNAILTRKEVVRNPLTMEDEEDHSDLLQIEDDFEELMSKGKRTDSMKSEDLTETSQPSKTSSETTRPAPKIPTKPNVAAKPKPQIATKPNLKSDSSSGKPSIPQKPKPLPPSKPSQDDPKPTADTDDSQKSVRTENLGQDDITKYLMDNLESNSEEVDLFS